jgi:SAM-dependent methyltransferase
MPSRWCDSAELRCTQIESKLDLTFNEVFKPIFMERISRLSPSRVLEVGAGTGHLSKALSTLSCHITAIEPSMGMWQVASRVLSDTKVDLINCASHELKESFRCDVAFSHLVAHVVDDLPFFLESVARHLVKGGHFVFSIPHPCFYNDYKKLFGSEYNYMKPMIKDISFSITKDVKNRISGVPYHHKPLSSYINNLVSAGFALDGFDETYPSDEIQDMYGSRWESPRYCVFVCKKL